MPFYLAKVFNKPRKFLNGPWSEKKKSKEEHFVIVGGGIGGLTSAFLLLQVGHKVTAHHVTVHIMSLLSLQVTLLESSQRMGGRVFTHYGKGYYADLGAMRFPPDHTVLHSVQSLTFNMYFSSNFFSLQVLKNLAIPVTRFTNDFESQGSYLFLGGKYYAVDDLALRNENAAFDEEKLMELYKLFDVKNPPRDENGKLLHIKSLQDEILGKVDLKNLCKNDR